MSVGYRVGQFFRALTARVSTTERDDAAAYLGREQMALFDLMPVRDRRHALDVLGRLRAAGARDPALLQAALLHDVGKAPQRVGLITRVAVVLLRRLDGGLSSLARADGPRWRRALYAQARHAELGADLAAAAGSSPEVVRLIREHGDVPRDALARALQAADNES